MFGAGVWLDTWAWETTNVAKLMDQAANVISSETKSNNSKTLMMFDIPQQHFGYSECETCCCGEFHGKRPDLMQQCVSFDHPAAKPSKASLSKVHTFNDIIKQVCAAKNIMGLRQHLKSRSDVHTMVTNGAKTTIDCTHYFNWDTMQEYFLLSFHAALDKAREQQGQDNGC